VAYSLIHGAATGFYPYPFINVREFGYDKIFLNMGVLLLVFIALSLALIAIDRRIGIAQTTHWHCSDKDRCVKLGLPALGPLAVNLLV
jgi:hypothetical protein